MSQTRPTAGKVFSVNDMRYINPRFTYLLTYEALSLKEHSSNLAS